MSAGLEIRTGGGSPVRDASAARYLLPTGMACGQWQWPHIHRSGEVGERGGPCPGFGARKTLGLNSAEHPEFPDRMVGVRAHATSSA